MAFLQDIIDILKKSKNIGISAHVNPDGDAIGSCFALAFALKKMGKNPIVLLDDYNSKFNIIPGKEFLYKGDINSLKVDTFVCLDVSPTERLGKAYELFKKTDITICIDHHKSNNSTAKYNFVNADASSTCELVFELVNKMVELDKNMGTALYAGLVGDTGGFKHLCTSPQTLRTAATLMELDIPFNNIYNEIMYVHTLVETKIFTKAIERLEILENLPIAYTYIDIEDLKEVGANSKNLDGIVEYSLNTVGVEISMFIYQLGDAQYKVSFRSKKADISNVCVKFGGGGHALAAGFNSQKSKQEIFDEIIPLLKEVLK